MRPSRWLLPGLLGACLWCASGLAGTAPSARQALSADQRRADFEQLVDALRQHYAMVEYKARAVGVEFDRHVATFRSRLAGLTADDSFYDFLARFIAGFEDGHLQIRPPFEGAASLGVRSSWVEGKVVVTAIDPGVGPVPFAVGDELVALDDRPATSLMDEWAPLAFHGREEARLTALARRLTERFGRHGPLPSGTCRLTVRRHRSSETVQASLPWTTGEESGEKAPEILPGWAPRPCRALPFRLLPACVFASRKGPLGYVRIPTFAPDDVPGAVRELDSHLAALARAGARGLVVDVTGNGGGHAGFARPVLRRLISGPVRTFGDAMRADLWRFRHIQRFAGDETTDEALSLRRDQLEIQKAMVHGQLVTAPVHPMGEVVEPASVHWNGPFVLLIDAGSLSYAEFFAATVQDSKAAVLFGATTGGLGGTIQWYGGLRHSGFDVAVTRSLVVRRDGSPIENVGVRPDVPWSLTQEDVAKGYSAYVDGYVDTLLRQIRR